ncbi:hypothetical protein EIN_096780 [Entamoeba invadens IP1]|uniref:Uncharacterized protein n=1 Tax=Entamoeba invadens IP1 TaxID=370355 RepID=A0A0A1U6H6_ENTIV|nr:hypothetical protein EIN_096780 [Entamoeba invadens IP1]ELP87411.1 hypothetical protein EIN_096780 [Entamoeba invadens IP1]|eukprot:XP_004254182.1 hypothetical protein EIN_096780 [Entamoeba invadens IP1]
MSTAPMLTKEQLNRLKVVKRKSQSVQNENRREIVYLSVLDCMGYSFVLTRPKKTVVKSVLPFIHISKIIDPSGAIVLSYEDIRTEAYSLKIGEGKKDQERRITQYVKNKTVNLMIDMIIGNQFIFNSEEGPVKQYSINTLTPPQRRLEFFVMFDGTNCWYLDVKNQTTCEAIDIIHKNLFDQVTQNNFSVPPSAIDLSHVMQFMPTLPADAQSVSNQENQESEKSVSKL